MNTNSKPMITIHTIINAQKEVVWERWTTPEDIIRWNAASDDWHTPKAQNDLRTGGSFLFRMEAKNESMGFDFGGIYTDIIPNEVIEYTIDDSRKVKVLFTSEQGKTKVTEIFEAESTHSLELQQGGWQSILDNFKRYVESTI